MIQYIYCKMLTRSSLKTLAAVTLSFVFFTVLNILCCVYRVILAGSVNDKYDIVLKYKYRSSGARRDVEQRNSIFSALRDCVVLRN